MANRGTIKHFSQEQEEYIAKVYDGKVTRNSGATYHSKGDVVCEHHLIEAKFAGTPAKPAKSIRIQLDDLEKICREAWSADTEPMMALMIHNPESPLADTKGNIHMALRLVEDDRWLFSKS